ncbi:hypothetical protein LVD15_01740 [Fulvivirga maritima]|uniref:hypothetical protein n=1 Tax=Fulvivirga maritima TaxID=2904247 RepID=UPI001F285E20|nr:hypothetical protein [Fulvivirga maritima]UII27173.1 hypothetical protein LVD15_01740 [Fulvivirga maritima]
MSWKRIQAIGHLFLVLFLFLSIYRFFPSVDTDNFYIDLIILVISLTAIFLQFSYLRCLNLVFEGSLKARENLVKSEAAVKFALILYIILALELFASQIVVLVYAIKNELFFVMSSLKLLTLGGLIFTLIKSVNIRKQTLPEFTNEKQSGFFGTWKSAVVLIILGLLKLTLGTISDGLGFALVISGIIRLVMVLKKK